MPNLVEKATSLLFGNIIENRVKEIEQKFFEEGYRYAREEDRGYRPLNTASGEKDLMPQDYIGLHKAVFKAYDENPLAKGIIDMQVNFIVGEGITVSCTDNKTQDVVNKFWDDRHNNMKLRVFSLLAELCVYGEQFIVCFPDLEKGTLQIIQKDPILVESIATDVNNYEKNVLIILNKKIGDGKSKAYVSHDILPEFKNITDFTEESLKALLPSKVMIGDTEHDISEFEIIEDAFCKHYKINSVSSAIRGKSDLATVINWLTIYDEGLMNAMRLRRFRSAFLFDLTLEGANQPAIDAKMQWLMEHPPKPGSINVHNDKEKWDVTQPKLDSADNETDLRQVKLHIASGLNIPEHYLAEGGNANRSTADAMGLPTIKKMKARQLFFGQMLEDLVNMAIDINIISSLGVLEKSINRTFSLDFPDIDSKDNLQIAESVAQAITALTMAKTEGWISDKTAQRLMFKFLGEEIDFTEEEAEIKKDGLITKDYKKVGANV